MEKICIVCNKKFKTKNKEQVTCSYACNAAPRFDRECAICGKPFKGKPRTKYCSDECKRKARIEQTMKSRREKQKRLQREMERKNKNVAESFAEYTKKESYAERQIRETCEKSDMELRKRHYEWKLKHGFLT